MAFCASLAAGPAAADDKPAGCKITPEKVAVDTTPPINIGILANALIYYRCTDYDDQVKSVLNEARAWVAARAPGVAKPAIVLDIDETSLSNWEEIYHNNFGYIPSGACDLHASSACGQHDWELSAQTTAIGPTLDLFTFAKMLKGKNGEPVDVFFITGRFEDPFERMATEWNLRKVGYDNWRGLLCVRTRPKANSSPTIKPWRASGSRPIIRSSPISAISSAIWLAIKTATTPRDALRSPILSILSRVIRYRAADSSAWRVERPPKPRPRAC
ncbi:MAG: HAD family acid phosphatase [Xanthobacteraceae bacterium]